MIDNAKKFTDEAIEAAYKAWAKTKVDRRPTGVHSDKVPITRSDFVMDVIDWKQ